MYTVLSERMHKECPKLTVGIVLDQVRDLCVAVAAAKDKGVTVASSVGAEDGLRIEELATYVDAEVEFMEKLFQLIDV
jgi:hypothetical protein